MSTNASSLDEFLSNANVFLIQGPTEELSIDNTFNVCKELNLNTFIRLSKKIPNGVIKICESGLTNNNQLRKLCNKGADGFLVGEYLMASEDLKSKTMELIRK